MNTPGILKALNMEAGFSVSSLSRLDPWNKKNTYPWMQSANIRVRGDVVVN